MVQQILKVDELPMGARPRPAGFTSVGAGDDERRIAFLQAPAGGKGAALPGLVWLGGVKSHMRSTKASAPLARAEEHGRSALALDHFGHGESRGAVGEGAVGRRFGGAL